MKRFSFVPSVVLMIALCLNGAQTVSAAMSDRDFVKLCERGSVQEIQNALKDGANPNAWGKSVLILDEDSMTALMAAAIHNSSDAVLVLLEAGADVHAKNENKYTALDYSRISNNLYVTKLLSAVMSDSGFVEFCKDCSFQRIQSLLNMGFGVNVRDENGMTPLMAAAGWNENLDVVFLLREAGCEVNAKDKKGQTALMLAAEYNENPEVVPFLLKEGADVNAKDKDGRTALDHTRYSGRSAAAGILAPLTTMRDGEFVKLCENGSVQQIQVALRAGANPNAKDGWGVTALMRAAANNPSRDVLPLLLKAGANVNGKDKDGNTALMLAVYQAKPDTVSLLLKAGAEVNAKNNSGTTALWWAAGLTSEAISFKIVSLLLDAGADVNAVGGDRLTALGVARQSHNYASAEALEKAANRKPSKAKARPKPLNAGNSNPNTANASIAGDRVNVRSRPNTSSRVIKQLNAGHPVNIIRQEGDWYLIRTASGTEGWVFGKFVKR